MDTKTRRTATRRTSRGFYDDEPVLDTVKVPADPAQVSAHHASFRVELPGPLPVSRAVTVGTALPTASPGAPTPVPRVPTARRRPVVWSGHSAPGDAGTRPLLQAVAYRSTERGQEADRTATRVLPRVAPGTGQSPPPAGAGADDTPRGTPPTVVSQRSPRQATHLLVRSRQGGAAGTAARPGGATPDTPVPSHPGVAGACDGGGATALTRPFPAPAHLASPAEEPVSRDADARGEAVRRGGGTEGRRPRRGRRSGENVRHAYYPGHRMDLGLVLLPLRIFLGLSSLYAGMGKLTNPAFFEGGGERGSIVHWLASLEPWAVAAPLLRFAVAHPVGAGLTVAFLQIIVGVLTLAGLWQRLAATIGALLSAALLVTVSWRAAPAYDVPDIIYLAAWSPLAIAGAPVFSLDARLAGEAWRRLGPRVSLWDLRRRVLRRGALLASLVVGLALLTGSLLGGAVRTSQVATVPESDGPPVNRRPGSPLPQRPSPTPERTSRQPDDTGPTGRAGESGRPSASATPGAPAGGDAGDGARESTPRRPAAPTPPPAAPTPPPSVPRTPERAPSDAGSVGGGEEGPGTEGGTGGGGSQEPSGDGDRGDRGALGGLLG